MSSALSRAAKGARKEKRKAVDDTESEDSDAVQLELERKERRIEAKRALKQKVKEGEAIQKQHDKQCAVTASKMKELAAKRNKYPVIFISFGLHQVSHGFNFRGAD